MKHKLLILFTLATLLLIVLFGFAWAISTYRQDMILFNAASNHPWALISYQGRLTLLYEPRAFDPSRLFWPFADWDLVLEQTTWLRRISLPQRPADFLQTYCTTDAEHNFLGLDLNLRSSRSISILDWQLALLSTLPLLVYLLLTRKHHRAAMRRAKNLCPLCSYDLRASKDRCPECGAPIPSPGPSHVT